jgi:hypothetical protein
LKRVMGLVLTLSARTAAAPRTYDDNTARGVSMSRSRLKKCQYG